MSALMKISQVTAKTVDSERKILYYFTHVGCKKKANELYQNRNRFIDAENKLMFAIGRGSDGN